MFALRPRFGHPRPRHAMAILACAGAPVMWIACSFVRDRLQVQLMAILALTRADPAAGGTVRVELTTGVLTTGADAVTLTVSSSSEWLVSSHRLNTVVPGPIQGADCVPEAPCANSFSGPPLTDTHTCASEPSAVHHEIDVDPAAPLGSVKLLGLAVIVPACTPVTTV